MNGTVKIFDNFGKEVYSEKNVTMTAGKALLLNNLNKDSTLYGIRGVLVGGYFLDSSGAEKYAYLDSTNNTDSEFNDSVTLVCGADVPTALLRNALEDSAYTTTTTASKDPNGDFESSVIAVSISPAAASSTTSCVQDLTLSFTLVGDYASHKESADRYFMVAELALIATDYTDLSTVASMDNAGTVPKVVAYHRLATPYPKNHGQTISMQWLIHD